MIFFKLLPPLNVFIENLEILYKTSRIVKKIKDVIYNPLFKNGQVYV